MLGVALQTMLVPGTDRLEIVLHADAGAVDTRQRYHYQAVLDAPYPWTFEMLEKYPAGVGVGYEGENQRVMHTGVKHLVVRGVSTVAQTLDGPTLPGLRGRSNYVTSTRVSIRMFYVNVGGRLELSNLVLLEGDAYRSWQGQKMDDDLDNGGAIHNKGVLLVGGCWFLCNVAYGKAGGAISNSGKAFVFESTFTKNGANYRGGSIINFQSGELRVASSSFQKNYVYSNGNGGGAIYNHKGHVSVVSSTFMLSSAADSGNCQTNKKNIYLMHKYH